MSTGEIMNDDPFGVGEEPAEPIGDAPDDEFGSRVRFNRLKQLAKSPAHYLANPGGESSAQDKGTAVHAVLLGGKRITFYPEKTKAGKAAPRNGGKWEAFRAENASAKIVTAKEYDQVSRMVEAVRANRMAMELLDGATHEETILFEMLGLECRSTPDFHAPDRFGELKTTVSADPFRFGWQAKKMSYHAQMALHREALKRTRRIAADAIGYIIAVESTLPYPVTVMRVPEKALEIGDKQIRRWMETLKGCLSSNQWPAYAQNVVDLELPEAEELSFADGAEPATGESLPQGW
jgi:hypothetical protein